MNSNAIQQWAESFASQDENQFFNTIRLYLGEVKTPYNKQKLTAQLASFIRKPETTKSIISLLDKKDLCILTAINYISRASQKNICEFFSGTYSFSEIYSSLCNLTDRLLIYTSGNSNFEKSFDKNLENPNKYFYINPLLKDELLPLLTLDRILPEEEIIKTSVDDIFYLTPNFLAAFISFLKIQGCSCKSDGVFKKNEIKKLSEIFPGKENCLQYLITAFINLSLVIEDEKKLRVENSRLEKFADLPEIQQYALLCAASVSRFSRDGLKKEAQILIDCFSSISPKGYSRSSILHLAFLTGTYTEDGSAVAVQSRFSRMIQMAKTSENEEIQNANLLDRMIDSAIEMGLLQFAGKNEKNENIYVKGSIFEENSAAPMSEKTSENPKVLNIESTFGITLMPGLSLKKLLPLTSFMNVKKWGVVTEFEMNRTSLSFSFDNDWIPEKIFTELEKYAYYSLPQNLKENIIDWYNSYSSAILYCGYVLKVNSKNINLVENSPKIKKYVKEKLADGIYLLNLPANANPDDFIEESSLDFMGTVKNSQNQSENFTFPLLRKAQKLSFLNEEIKNQNEILENSEQNQEIFLDSLMKKLETLDFSQNKKESLARRIAARLILNENQLQTASIRTEILEADGMDYNGKIYLIETAIENNDMLELQLPKPDGEGFFTVTGKCLMISKQIGEAIIRFQFEPEKQIESILISRITHVRRLRF